MCVCVCTACAWSMDVPRVSLQMRKTKYRNVRKIRIPIDVDSAHCITAYTHARLSVRTQRCLHGSNAIMFASIHDRVCARMAEHPARARATRITIATFLTQRIRLRLPLFRSAARSFFVCVRSNNSPFYGRSLFIYFSQFYGNPANRVRWRTRGMYVSRTSRCPWDQRCLYTRNTRTHTQRYENMPRQSGQ